MGLLFRLAQSKAIKFLVVGGTATVLQFALLVVLVETTSLGKVASSAMSYVLSAMYNYLANYYLTFQSSRSHWLAFPRFCLVVLVGATVNTAVFAVFLRALPYVAAQVIAIAAALVSNYLLHKYWIYRGEHDD